MKLQIQDNIIETKYIYRIEDIEPIYSGVGDFKNKTQIIFRFKIHFLNKKDGIIIFHASDMGDEKIELLNKEKLNNLKTKLIEYWHGDPIEITKLTIE